MPLDDSSVSASSGSATNPESVAAAGSNRALEGKVAVVTGGASGIGRAIAERYLAEGATVVLGDRNDALLAQVADEMGSERIEAVPTDVTIESDVAALVARAVESFGRLDVAVNSAGLGTIAPIHAHPRSEWDRVIDICLTGVFLSTKHEAAQLVAQGDGGVIINIASINARVPAAGMVAYCSAKAGVEMLTKCAAIELGPHNIRVAGIGPGVVETPLTQFAKDTPAIGQAYLDSIPLGRVGQPKDIADAALFLASDQASWVTGTTLFVDGAEMTQGYPNFFDL